MQFSSSLSFGGGSGKYHAKPVNFERFLALGQPSPLEELEQLIPSSRCRVEVSDSKVSSPLFYVSDRAEPVQLFPSHLKPLIITPLLPFFASCCANGDVDAMDSQMREEVALHQYGSVLYDPVEAAYLCWEGHELRQSQQREAEGISCDFCGWTVWNGSTSQRSSQSSFQQGPSKPTGVDNTMEATCVSPPCTRDTHNLNASHFRHCKTCGTDICLYCCEDVLEDRRYHIPCMQCQVCKTYIRFREGVSHQCYPSTRVLDAPMSETVRESDGATPVPEVTSSSNREYTVIVADEEEEEEDTVGTRRRRRRAVVQPLKRAKGTMGDRPLHCTDSFFV